MTTDKELQNIKFVREALRRAIRPINAEDVQASVYLEEGVRIRLPRVKSILATCVFIGVVCKAENETFFVAR